MIRGGQKRNVQAIRGVHQFRGLCYLTFLWLSLFNIGQAQAIGQKPPQKGIEEIIILQSPLQNHFLEKRGTGNAFIIPTGPHWDIKLWDEVRYPSGKSVHRGVLQTGTPTGR